MHKITSSVSFILNQSRGPFIDSMDYMVRTFIGLQVGSAELYQVALQLSTAIKSP